MATFEEELKALLKKYKDDPLAQSIQGFLKIGDEFAELCKKNPDLECVIRRSYHKSL
jgi:hypothetical protein